MKRFVLAAGVAALMSGPALAETYETERGAIEVTPVAEGLADPWGIDFLPDGSMLITEKGGTLRTVSPDGTLSDPIAGVPDVDARDQGGLLDIAVHPDFARNRLVYFTFSEPGQGRVNSTALARGKLSEDGRGLSDVVVIFSQKPKVASTKHYGSRIVFDGDGRIFVGLGERSDEQFRGQAQDLKSHLGKVVRINEDGSVPPDNPFASGEGGLPEIWSYGHRNIQSAAINPATGQLWVVEHGPRGGDEINIAEPGKNYGWPKVSFGVNYNGSPVGTGEARAEGMVDPIYQWTPVIAPSGMLFYSGDAVPEWKGDLFVGGLRSQALVRLELDGGKVVHEERLLTDLGKRIRDVAQGPDGALYVITDESDASVLRIAGAD
ncbi:PQQ-dependent sugar dehydrogenase [Chthonobacter rhizosphaerae]|uniref:PQQ-dependent sugar dehydrogenase n=1 Tax=Chthonobacter rhizosphaerae TaxID=2735553 RepID=UPI0015EFB192|nr:PQQ-dependent sugar dehydrogenase [Chthonobacter rhizosphaerae]